MQGFNGGGTGVPVLTIRDVSVSFGGVKALTDVSFDVPEGGVTAVIGPNGAGKTTLFNCVSGLNAYAGDIALGGTGLGGAGVAERARRGIARTFQTPLLVEDRSVIDNVLLGAHGTAFPGLWRSALRLPAERRREHALRVQGVELIERVGLTVDPGRLVRGLPHRDRRLIEIARALIARPRVLLLDEPAAGSTHAEATSFLRAAMAIAEQEGTTIVLVEHNVPLVLEVARHVVVLVLGSLLHQGTAEDVRGDARVVEAYLGAAA